VRRTGRIAGGGVVEAMAGEPEVIGEDKEKQEAEES
jgi:hypothetical protein